MTEDTQLLRDYAREKSQDAFAELVRRHLNLVYSAALRQVRSPQLAEEVSQSVFLDLGRAAGQLKPQTILTAWLYQVTRRTAIDVIRRESRRQARERLAVEMAAMNTTADWAHIEPLLEDAMETLDETDRAAILLRFFENKSLREVGQSLGTSDDAAQKRVSRAVDQLREFFSKRGVTVAATGLVVLISANAVQSAPVALAATISTAAITGAAVHSSAAIATTKALAITAFQKMVLTGTAVVVLAGTGTYEVHHASQLRDQAKNLREEKVRLNEIQTQLNEQLADLQQEKSSLSNELATLREDNARLQRDRAELLKLRAEVQSLRDATNELESLRQEKNSSYQEQLQLSGKIQLMGSHRHGLAEGWMRAFMDYANRHAGQFPATFDEAKPFFPASIETWGDAKPDDFEILYKGSVKEIVNREVVLLRERKLSQESEGVWGRFDVVVAGPWNGGTEPTSMVRYERVPAGFADAGFTDFEKARVIPSPGQ